MDLVALTELATTADAEANPLATVLGVTPYEARQKLAVGLPAVVLRTDERARATALLAELRGRGHGAVAFEAQAVVPTAKMLLVRRLRFDAGAVSVGEAGDAPEQSIPYEEVVALIRAVHRHTTETRQQTSEKKFRPVAAIVSGGVILTKTVKTDVVRSAEDKEQVVYLFRRSGAPCLFRESGVDYAGLGARVLPTRLQNFTTTVRLLREHAPLAPYDERLVSLKKPPEPPNEPGGLKAFDRETGGVDLLAHVLAMWLSRGG